MVYNGLTAITVEASFGVIVEMADGDGGLTWIASEPCTKNWIFAHILGQQSKVTGK